MNLDHQSNYEAQVNALRTALMEEENSGTPTAMDFDKLLLHLAIKPKRYAFPRKEPSNRREETS